MAPASISQAHFSTTVINKTDVLKATGMSSAAEMAYKKQKIMNKTNELTQHLLSRSKTTVKAVSTAGGQAYIILRKFKIFM